MRSYEMNRKTAETDIQLYLNLDGTGKSDIDSGCGFLDHMLTLFAAHGKFDLNIRCSGDTYVDDHHSVEDIGICLGQAFREALGEKRGINRYGSFLLPMDEALILSAVDISGRSCLCYDLDIPTEKIGTFDTELVEEFFLAFTRNCPMSLHLRKLSGKNAHHIVEGAFKSVARALKAAVASDGTNDIPSTKGGAVMVGIVDYGVGNLFSLHSSFKAIGQEAFVSGEPEALAKADRLVLPGVGAFGDAANKLRQSGLSEFVRRQVGEGKPLLGICLGMQLLFEKSYEYGKHEGLGLLKGQVIPMEGKLPKELKIPHMGWNKLDVKAGRLLQDVDGEYVYFVHSYYASGCENSLAAVTDYGIPITAAVEQRNIFGCQFHPEKSGSVGLRILKNFCEL